MAKKPPKKQIPKTPRWIHFLDVFIIVTTVGLIAFGIWNMQTKQAANTGPCAKVGTEHQVVLKDDVFTPATLAIKQCDIVKIVNLDPVQNYVLALGVHEKHISYPGFEEQPLRPNEFFVFDAVQAGNYRMHDHLRDKAAMDFTIKAIE